LEVLPSLLRNRLCHLRLVVKTKYLAVAGIFCLQGPTPGYVC
jgi:hypothetical protein